MRILKYWKPCVGGIVLLGVGYILYAWGAAQAAAQLQASQTRAERQFQEAQALGLDLGKLREELAQLKQQASPTAAPAAAPVSPPAVVPAATTAPPADPRHVHLGWEFQKYVSQPMFFGQESNLPADLRRTGMEKAGALLLPVSGVDGTLQGTVQLAELKRFDQKGGELAQGFSFLIKDVRLLEGTDLEHRPDPLEGLPIKKLSFQQEGKDLRIIVFPLEGMVAEPIGATALVESGRVFWYIRPPTPAEWDRHAAALQLAEVQDNTEALERQGNQLFQQDLRVCRLLVASLRQGGKEAKIVRWWGDPETGYWLAYEGATSEAGQLRDGSHSSRDGCYRFRDEKEGREYVSCQPVQIKGKVIDIPFVAIPVEATTPTKTGGS